MKFIIALILPLFALSLSAQQNSLDEIQNNPLYEVKISADSIADIFNRRTNQRYYLNLQGYDEPEKMNTADLVIDLDTVNLANYAHLYRRWGGINAANTILDAKYIVLDANKDGKNEIYAGHVTEINAAVYEHVADSLFEHKLDIGDSVWLFCDIGDITNDGLYNIICKALGNSLRIYKPSSDTSYISELDFIYNPFPDVYQPNDVTFYDIDKDGVLEIIYYLDAGDILYDWAQSNHVARYNTAINNYELIYYHRPSPYWFTFGFATGDFDDDGKNNFSTGSIVDKYYFYEHVTGDSIKVEQEKELDSKNIFYSVMTEDMNGNGKKEIWAGSQFISNEYGGVIRIFVMETDGNESYEVIYQVDINGLFPFVYGRIRYIDIDGDGIKEIFFNAASLVFCFKYSEEKNFYLDFIIDAWEDEPIFPGDHLEGVDIADLDGDGIPEIILQKYVGPPYQDKSLFWKRNITVDVKDEENPVPGEFNLYQNYPNPFNPETRIEFYLSKQVEVTLKVYNIIGKEIITLLLEEISPGYYAIDWEAKDSNGQLLPSGMYLIRLIAGEYTQTIKALFLK